MKKNIVLIFSVLALGFFSFSCKQLIDMIIVPRPSDEPAKPEEPVLGSFENPKIGACGETSETPNVKKIYLDEEDVVLVEGIEPGDWYWYVDENYFRYNPNDPKDIEDCDDCLYETTPEIYTAIRIKKWKEWIPGKWIDENDSVGYVFNEDGSGMHVFTPTTWTISKDKVEMHGMSTLFGVPVPVDREMIYRFESVDKCVMRAIGIEYRYKPEN